jgi:hypothetical protein
VGTRLAAGFAGITAQARFHTVCLNYARGGLGFDPKRTLDRVADQHRIVRDRERPTLTGPHLLSFWR